MADTETALINTLLMSMIPEKDTDPPDGMLQLAAEFWIENRRCVDPRSAEPLLYHPALPPVTAARIVGLEPSNPELMRTYLGRSDPSDIMARRIADAGRLRITVSEVRVLGTGVADLLADVDDACVSLALGGNRCAPFMARVRGLRRAGPADNPESSDSMMVKKAARELFEHCRLDDAGEVAGALRLLQDTPVLRAVLEKTLAGSATAAITGEVVALLHLTESLGLASLKQNPGGLIRHAVYSFLHDRFGEHVPFWDMFAKLASPDQTIGETVALVLEVESSGS